MHTKNQIQNWSRHYGKPISETEYKEIYDNLWGFFSVLKEWSDKEEKKSNENERNIDNRNKHIPSQT